MKLALVCALFFTINLSAFSQEKLPTNSQLESQQSFEDGRARATIVQAPDAHQREQKKAVESCGMGCQIKKVQLKTRRFILTAITWIKDLFDFNFSLNLNKFKKSSTLNLPPTVGNIFFFRAGSGPAPRIEFRLSSFSDSDGTIAKVRWEFGDGTQIEYLAGQFNAEARVLHVYKNSAHYVVKVYVEDNLGAVTTAQSYVETFDNTQPQINFTATRDVSDPLKATFNIQGSDVDGETVTLTTGGCPSAPNSTSAVINCTFPSAGTYPMNFTVIDQNRTTVRAEAIVTVGGATIKATPVALFDSDKIYGIAPLTVNFDAGYSFDIDGTILSYEWNFAEYNRPGNYSNKKITSHTFTKPGTYTVRLQVKDNEGNIGTHFKDIYVDGPGQVPHIALLNTSALKIEVDAENTSFPVGVSSSMMFWNYGDGVKETGRWLNHTYSAAGTYTVELKYIDIYGITHNLSKEITISSTNNSPIASFVANKYRTVTNDDIIYNASASSDPQASQPLSYRWVFFDGEQFEDTDPEAIKRYSEQGLKVTELIVTNSRGFTAKTRVFAEIMTESRSMYPVVFFNPKISSGTFTVNFDGSQTKSELGKIVSHEWLTDGDNTTLGATASRNYTSSGQYWFQYVATDSQGNQAIVYDRVVSLASSPPGGNANPVAVINTYTEGGNPRWINYDCYNSTDSDGYVAYCEWTLNGKPINHLKKGLILLNEDISYVFEVKVIDNWGAVDIVKKRFDFRPAPVTIADFDYIPLRPIKLVPMTFGADESILVGRRIVSYAWNFGDSTSGNGEIVTHTYATSGSKTITLTITDDLGATTVVSKSIAVADSGTTNGFAITARPSDLSGKIIKSQTYRSFNAPETLRFEASGTSVSDGVMKDIVWNFGNGEYGYGANVEYTYFSAGTYTVTATGKTPGGLAVSATMTIIVEDNDCSEKHTDTTCLKLVGSTNNILAMNKSKWTVGHGLGLVNFSTTSSDYPDGWAYLLAQDGSGEKIGLNDAWLNEGKEISLIREKLLERNIDLSKPYKIFLKAKSTTGSNIFGETKTFYFGGSKLEINMSEVSTRLELVQTGSMFRKYYDLTGDMKIILSNIPSGDYVLVATKDTRQAIRKIKLRVNEFKKITIDLNTEFEEFAQKRSVASSNKNMHENPPSWTQGLCGEPSPFMMSPKRNISPGEVITRKFSSSNPEAQFTYQAMGRNMPRPTILSCGVTTPSILYGQNKWKYKEGPGRCERDYAPHSYWQEYLKTLNKESDAIVIAYEIKDFWTSETMKGQFITSARDIMLKQGRDIADLSSKVGLGSLFDENGDFAQRINYILPIPVQFRRPEIKFKLISSHNTSESDYYNVECDLINSTTKPTISEIIADPMNTTPLHTADANARISLSEKYKFFPAQFDDRSTSAVLASSEAGKARYRIKVQRKENANIVWQGVEVEFIYAEQTFTKFYEFTNAVNLLENILDRSYVAFITVNSADIKNKFQWQSGEKNIVLKMTPVGKNLVDYDFRGEPKSMPFTALFDLQTVKEDYPVLCSGGFTPTSSKLTTFVRDELLTSLLIASSDLNASLKCGDASTPFGGRFNLPSWQYNSLRYGNEIFIKSINDPGNHDLYDDFSVGSPLRMGDVDEYMNFSANAKLVSEIATEYDGMSLPTAKKKLHTFCRPAGLPAIEPCKSETLFTDLDHDMILKICQWNMTASTMPSGCPATDETRIMRFSSWVEKNTNTFNEWSKASPLEVFISAGAQRSPTTAPLIDWQKEALMYGLWPDGKPIWKTTNTLESLTAERAGVCHNERSGCESLERFFINDNKYFSTMAIQNGWR